MFLKVFSMTCGKEGEGTGEGKEGKVEEGKGREEKGLVLLHMT